jgi:hypothetical protein
MEQTLWHVIEQIFMLQMKAASYLDAVLVQEGPAQTSWCSKWAVYNNNNQSL